MNYFERAKEKLTNEQENFHGGEKEAAIKKALYHTLMDFCRQDEEFAQAVVQCDKTLGDCAAETLKGVGNSISDIEVYRRAVAFYFPGAGVRMQMTVDMCASVAGEDARKEKHGIVLDLSDFL